MRETVLVTGGLGYIGYHVVRGLLKEGFCVRIMDSMLYDFQPNNSYEFIKGDIRNEKDIKKSLNGVDYVIHLAALSNDPSCDVSPKMTKEINYGGTKKVSELAKEANVKRFIFPSSCSVYGSADKKFVSEKDKVNPLSLYAKTKLDSENQLKSLVDEDFDVGIFRLPTLFGHSDSMRFDLIANIIPLEAFEGKIKLFGGSQSRPFLHVKDASEVLVKALKHDGLLGGEVYNVGDSEKNYTIRKITELIQKNLFPDVEIEEYPKNTDIRSYQVNFSKIKNLLNYEAKIGLLEGVSEIAKNLELKKYGNPRQDKYFRVKYLKKRKEY